LVASVRRPPTQQLVMWPHLSPWEQSTVRLVLIMVKWQLQRLRVMLQMW
jgi:hypothetical protein